jgi:hypothetical protein
VKSVDVVGVVRGGVGDLEAEGGQLLAGGLVDAGDGADAFTCGPPFWGV